MSDACCLECAVLGLIEERFGNPVPAAQQFEVLASLASMAGQLLADMPDANLDAFAQMVRIGRTLHRDQICGTPAVLHS